MIPAVTTADDTRPDDAPAGLWIWRAVELGRRALGRYFGRSGPRLAAAVAYYVLLSLFPIVIVIVAVAGAILTDPSVREDFVDALVDALPLTESGADSIDAVIRGVGDNASAVGLVSAVGLLWTASGMMAALRGGLDDLMGGTTPRRPFLQGKLVDLLMLLAAGLLLVAAAAITIADRVAQEQVVDPLGLPGIGLQAARFVLPVALAFGVLMILLRWVPSEAPRPRDLWPGALTAAVALYALTLGFAFFVQQLRQLQRHLRVARRGRPVPRLHLRRGQPGLPGGGVRGRPGRGLRGAAAARRPGLPRRAAELRCGASSSGSDPAVSGSGASARRSVRPARG